MSDQSKQVFVKSAKKNVIMVKIKNPVFEIPFSNVSIPKSKLNQSKRDKIRAI